MKLNKHNYVVHENIGEGHTVTSLQYAEIVHSHGILNLSTGYLADWWVAEAEHILRNYEEHPRWGDRLIFKHDHFHLWPFAFASAWEQETT